MTFLLLYNKKKNSLEKFFFTQFSKLKNKRSFT
nr:MAG TPA: hypothetical protein [Caudoviricetes sp.]